MILDTLKVKTGAKTLPLQIQSVAEQVKAWIVNLEKTVEVKSDEQINFAMDEIVMNDSLLVVEYSASIGSKKW